MAERTARLKISFGMPWVSTDEGQTALWAGDRITILKRVGSHYFCRVVYGNWKYPHTMHGWINKRWVK